MDYGYGCDSANEDRVYQTKSDGGQRHYLQSITPNLQTILSSLRTDRYPL